MTEDIFEIPFKVLTVLGLWSIENKNRAWRFFYSVYQSLTILYLIVFISFLMWDLYSVRKDIHKASYNLSGTMTTVMLLWKNTQALQKLSKIRHLQRDLRRRLHTLQDEEDRKILGKAAKEMKIMVVTVYAMGVGTMTGWLTSGFLLKSREQEDNLPLPLSIPWNHHKSPYYELAWLTVQICAEYDILLKNVEKINEWYRNNVAKRGEDFRVLTTEENSIIKEMIIRNIQHHQKITDCAKEAENCFVHMMVVQFGGSALLLTVVILDFIMVSKEMSFRFYPLMLFVLLLICDIYLFCHYGSRLIDKSHKLLVKMYGTPWEVMNEKNKQMVFLIILKAQRPPKLTVEKFADIDFYSLLKLTKIVYNVLYLLLHLAKDET